MLYVVYSLCAFAIAWIIGHSKITLDFRTWVHSRSRFLTDLLECIGCLGFHLGWIGYLLGIRLPHLFGSWWMDMITLALYTCASNLIIGRFVGVVD